jgi:hypothetical protein
MAEPASLDGDPQTPSDPAHHPGTVPDVTVPGSNPKPPKRATVALVIAIGSFLLSASAAYHSWNLRQEFLDGMASRSADEAGRTGRSSPTSESELTCALGTTDGSSRLEHRILSLNRGNRREDLTLVRIESDPEPFHWSLLEAEVAAPDEFFLGQSEVTRGQFQLVMGRAPELRGTMQDAPDLPASGVSWKDADEFCRRLGTIRSIPGHRGEKVQAFEARLPSHYEWEYAAKRLPWEEVSRDAWLGEHRSPRVTPRPTALKNANAAEVYDLIGNVKEWMNDRFGRWSDDPKDRAFYFEEGRFTVPGAGRIRVARGGSYRDPQTADNKIFLTSTVPFDPEEADNPADVGFRILVIRKK